MSTNYRIAIVGAATIRGKQLNEALAKLPPQHQAVLLLFYREGYKYEEISAQLNISLDQVERYLARAKQQLLSVDWRWD